jgi:hypothetical protein
MFATMLLIATILVRWPHPSYIPFITMLVMACACDVHHRRVAQCSAPLLLLGAKLHLLLLRSVLLLLLLTMAL